MSGDAAAAEGACVVLCTVPDEATAARLARGLVAAGLAACVNAIPGLRSFYRWEGEVHDDPEIQLVVKTRRARVPEVVAWLEGAHPYDVPEVLALPVVEGAGPYLRWIADETRG